LGRYFEGKVQMRFFTREWPSGLLSEELWRSVSVQYDRHFRNFLPKLPETIAQLGTTISIHDGLIQSAAVDQRTKELHLLLRCGDLQVGYYDLNLHYSGVQFGSLDLATLAAVARDSQVECLHDELDMDENSVYVHRILFTPTGEITIRAEK
jgi:hypothetical protein